MIPYLDVNEKSLQSPERVVHSEVITKLGHQQKFKGQDGVGKLLTVALQVADKLTNGNVELFHLARQVHNRQPEGREHKSTAMLNTDNNTMNLPTNNTVKSSHKDNTTMKSYKDNNTMKFYKDNTTMKFYKDDSTVKSSYKYNTP